jgi:hypothetical protein
MKAYELDANGYYISDIPFFDPNNHPPFFTLVELVGSFFKPKFDGTKWVEGDTRENHIGTVVYNITTKESSTITQLGPIPDGYTTQVPREFDSWDAGSHLWMTDVVLRNKTLKRRKLVEVNTAFETAMLSVRIDYTESEIMSWSKQENEAREWVLNNNYPTPLMDLIASSRNMDKIDLINKVILKADQYAYATGLAVGRRQALEDRIALVGVGEEYKLDQIHF